jgi:Zn-dependent peptidase ImmA (M78 family)/transcriptional regulator with XRE-family HTH domain
MALDTKEFGAKLVRYREQLELVLSEVATYTGIEQSRLADLERGLQLPTGDEVLILADFYKCDYRFFISNEKLAPFEQTENLYRRHGNEFSKEDRWRVQEFLFLCEIEQVLMQELGTRFAAFDFIPKGNFYKLHGQEAAAALRQHLGYESNQVGGDVYSDFRKIGFHIFRRHLANSNISGLMIRHPFAGPCILVNYSEDIYRQRFTAAHEAGHAILDREDFVVSFLKAPGNLVEVRANTFASSYLLPPSFLKNIPVEDWSRDTLIHWASKLNVSAIALAIGLKENGVITEDEYSTISSTKVPAHQKSDPELRGLEARQLERKQHLLERGLSTFYVSLCFDSLAAGKITNARAAEMLLISETELSELAALFRINLFAHD